MHKESHHTAKVFTWATAAVVLGLLAPVVVYVWTFGPVVSSDHTRWSEFGSAMSGIYSPLLAALALLVLLLQVVLQRSINVHQFDQAHIQQARADLEFYLLRLDDYLEKMPRPGFTVRDTLHERFQPRTAAELDTEELRRVAKDLDALAPQVLAVWFAIYPILEGLEAGATRPYTLARSTAVQKIIVMLSFETCAALDNYHRARTEGRLSVAYEFSSFSRSRTGP